MDTAEKPREETLPFACDTCGRRFVQEKRLHNHIRAYHASQEKEPALMTETKAITEPKTKNNTQPEQPTTAASPASLTPEERALVEQVSRSTDDWTAITEDDMLDYSLAEDPLKLPPEAKQRQDRKEMAYRWCERTPKRVAELTNASPPLKWWVANSTTAPYLQKYVDPTLGGICKLDQILLLKPWKLHQKVKDAVEGSARALYNSRELEKGGAQRVQSRDSSDHLRVIAGERAHIKGSDAVFEGESMGADVGDLVAAD